MTAMSISNYEGSADLFTFPNNPQTYNLAMDSNSQITQIAFRDYNIFAAGAGSIPKEIVLSGQFNGNDKWTNYRLLSKHIGQNNLLKKLYFESDKFYICVGRRVTQTNSGGRTNFVDYVASFQTVVNVLFGSTQKTSGTNAGNAKTYVEEITGTVTNGANDIVITDADGNELTVDSSVLTTGQAIVISLVKMASVGGNVNVTTFRHVTVAGTRTRKVKTTGGDGMLRIDAGANVSTIDLTSDNLTTAVVKFRDGYYM